jgi:hypothetical protein
MNKIISIQPPNHPAEPPPLSPAPCEPTQHPCFKPTPLPLDTRVAPRLLLVLLVLVGLLDLEHEVGEHEVLGRVRRGLAHRVLRRQQPALHVHVHVMCLWERGRNACV